MTYEKTLPIISNIARLITAFLLGITVVAFAEYGFSTIILIANFLAIFTVILCNLSERSLKND